METSRCATARTSDARALPNTHLCLRHADNVALPRRDESGGARPRDCRRQRRLRARLRRAGVTGAQAQRAVVACAARLRQRHQQRRHRVRRLSPALAGFERRRHPGEGWDVGWTVVGGEQRCGEQRPAAAQCASTAGLRDATRLVRMWGWRQRSPQQPRGAARHGVVHKHTGLMTTRPPAIRRDVARIATSRSCAPGPPPAVAACCGLRRGIGARARAPRTGWSS